MQSAYDQCMDFAPARIAYGTELSNLPNHIVETTFLHPELDTENERKIVPCFNPREMKKQKYEEWIALRAADRYALKGCITSITSIQGRLGYLPRSLQPGVLTPLEDTPEEYTNNILWTYLLTSRVRPITRIVPGYFAAVVSALQYSAPGAWGINGSGYDFWPIHRVGHVEVRTPPSVQLLDVEIIRPAVTLLFPFREPNTAEWTLPAWKCLATPGNPSLTDPILSGHLTSFVSRSTAYATETGVVATEGQCYIRTTLPSVQSWKAGADKYLRGLSETWDHENNIFYRGWTSKHFSRQKKVWMKKHDHKPMVM